MQINTTDNYDYLSQMEFLDALHPIPNLSFTHYWSYDHLINYHSWNFTYTVPSTIIDRKYLRSFFSFWLLLEDFIIKMEWKIFVQRVPLQEKDFFFLH